MGKYHHRRRHHHHHLQELIEIQKIYCKIVMITNHGGVCDHFGWFCRLWFWRRSTLETEYCRESVHSRLCCGSSANYDDNGEHYDVNRDDDSKLFLIKLLLFYFITEFNFVTLFVSSTSFPNCPSPKWPLEKPSIPSSSICSFEILWTFEIQLFQGVLYNIKHFSNAEAIKCKLS